MLPKGRFAFISENLVSQNKSQHMAVYCFIETHGKICLQERRFSLAKSLNKKMVFLMIESANKAEINIFSARDTTRPGL